MFARERGVLQKVLFLTRSLEFGGSERQLVELAKELRRRGVDVTVAQFYGTGPLAAELVEAAIPVVSLQKRGRWDVLGIQRSLSDVVRRESPTILHSYLVEPNVVAALMRPRFPRLAIVWGVRASDMTLANYGWIPRASFATSVVLSAVPDLIIANSHAGAAYHQMRGYPASRMMVIPNGIDTERFAPSSARRAHVRRELEIADHELVIGNLSRPDAIKDHATFLRGAALLRVDVPSARFLCIGAREGTDANSLRSLACSLGLDRSLIWLPPRAGMEELYNACDLVTSTSLSEGFPNMIAESMACGVPCVTTDVGDCRTLIGDAGRVVQTRAPDKLAAGWRDVAAMRSPELSARCRARITTEFGLAALGDRTVAALRGAAGRIGDRGA